MVFVDFNDIDILKATGQRSSPWASTENYKTIPFQLILSTNTIGSHSPRTPHMAPIRRYLRISQSSVLECRIFPENPADGPRWLLAPDSPALPRIMEAAKPVILETLREESDKSRDKGKKKKRFRSDIEQGSVCLGDKAT